MFAFSSDDEKRFEALRLYHV